MIHHLSIRDVKKTPVRWAHRVPMLAKNKQITFSPGLNVVFGPNGSGKSTLIDLLAMLMHAKDTNYSKVTAPSIRAFLSATGVHLDGAHLLHDGAPTRYLGIHDLAASPPSRAAKVPVGAEIEAALKKYAKEKRGDHQISTGQATLRRVTRFLAAEPAKTKKPPASPLLGRQHAELQHTALRSLLNTDKTPLAKRRMTTLLDEADIGLDFTSQGIYWRTLEGFAERGHQIIVCSHSPFAAVARGATFLETQPGYLETARVAIRQLLRDVDAPASIEPPTEAGADNHTGGLV